MWFQASRLAERMESLMVETRIGVRELKTHLSEYLRQVKAGQTILITEHGQPVGRIVPADQSLGERLQVMVKAGLVAWNGKKLEPMAPVAAAHGQKTVAELLIEDRE
jgi:prevent-host-death family protein